LPRTAQQSAGCEQSVYRYIYTGIYINVLYRLAADCPAVRRLRAVVKSVDKVVLTHTQVSI